MPCITPTTTVATAPTQSPHRDGLQLLLQDHNVTGCHISASAAKYWSELGASLAILRAGYNIGSLMLRWVC